MFGCPFGNLAGEMSTQDDVLRQRLTELFYELAEYFERILDEAVAAGEIPAQNTRATALAIEAYVEGMLLARENSQRPRADQAARARHPAPHRCDAAAR